MPLDVAQFSPIIWVMSNDKILVQATREMTKEIVGMTVVKITATSYLCEDAQGWQYRFRKSDGTISGSTKRNNTHTLTLESMAKLAVNL